ncbi:MAG: hypothetical protein GHCLOJNM_04016 [bacterium]|nr:hypothetical protein [bacterium]
MTHQDTSKDTLEDLKAIPKWTRRYAQNRTLPFLLFMLIYLLLSAAIGGGSYLGGKAYRAGNLPMFWASMAVAGAGVGFCFWFANPWWGGKWLEKVAARMYSREGHVSLGSSVPTTDRGKAWVAFAVSLFMVCILASVALGMAGFIPIRYMQPVSALYVAPFLVFLSVWLRPVAGWIPFLWPGLYTLHAILVIAGVPIQSEDWPSLNMLIPTVGYGTLCGLIGHFQGRHALKRLREIARAEE